MIKRLICFLWGHSVVHKAFTGNTMQDVDRLTGQTVPVPLYKWARTEFCTRCGKEVKP